MSRKNNLLKYQSITNGDMSLASIISAVTSIHWIDNIGIQFNFSGSPTGTFNIQVSADYAEDSFGNVTNVGNWTNLSATASASSGSPVYFDLNQLSSPWIRSVFVNTSIGHGSITTVADSSGSLNSKYFLINGADGDNWYVWLDNGSGVDPALPNRTGVQINYTNNASNTTIATAIGAGIAAITSITNINISGHIVTFNQTESGVGSLADGTAATGFMFSYTGAGSGTLNCFITGKML
jgi:hypothetical protein